jgi:hypothetical protein
MFPPQNRHPTILQFANAWLCQVANCIIFISGFWLKCCKNGPLQQKPPTSQYGMTPAKRRLLGEKF